MIKNYVRKSFSLLMSLIMIFSMLPIETFAAEETSHDHDHAEESIVEQQITTEETSDESSEEVTDESSEEVTDESSEEVTDESSEEVTDESSEEVTDESSEEVTDESSEEATDESSEEVTDESSEEATDESSEEVTDESSEDATDESSEEEGNLLDEVRGLIADYIEKFGISSDMSDEELVNHYITFDGKKAQAAWEEYEAGYAMAQGLSAEEGEILLAEENTQLVMNFYKQLQVLYGIMPAANSGEATLADGITLRVTSDKNPGLTANEDGSYTISATGYKSGCNDVKGNVDARIKNNSGKTVTFSFDWKKDGGVGTFKINGTDMTEDSGSATVTFASNNSYTNLIDSETSGTGESATATFTISNIVIKGTVSFGAAENGTYTVNGEAPADKTDPIGTEYTLVATPAEGYVLKAWYEDGNEVSRDAAYTYTNNGNATVTPEFISANMTVEFAAAVGNGSYTVNGEAAPVTKSEGTGAVYTLVATPNSEKNAFVGWFKDDAAEPFSKESSITLTTGKDILENCTVYAKFRDLTAYNITVESDASRGTVTSTGIWDGVGYEATPVTLTATPTAGYSFLAWTDADGKVVSTANPYTFTPTADVSVKAVFYNPNAEAWFKVGDYFYNDLNAAAAAGTKIVLAADGTLPAGDYTIPSGVTLLIPMDTSESVQTTQPKRVNNTDVTSIIAPSAYRTLHMAAGANITVEGAVSVAGSQYAGGTGSVMGGVHGPVGFIKMAEGSKITVNSGAYLYSWGYITGSGEVEVLGGGTAYESFQVTDWRGGSASSAIATNHSHKVFPMNQYYVQNVEVPMKLNAGAIEKGYTCTTITLAGVQGAEVPFVGTNSLFSIDSGYLIKDYDETTDRQVYKAYGNVSMKEINVSMKLSLMGSVTIKSSEFVLPITCNLTVDVVSGQIEITEDICFLPGAEIIVRDGAYCNLANGKSVYVYDLDEWGGYVGSLNQTFIPLPYAPGRLATAARTALTDAKIQIDGVVNADAGFLYTTPGGATVTSTGTGKVNMKLGTATETYQLSQSGTDTSPVAIPIQVAKLQNADGTTTDPANEVNPTYGTTYTYTDGKWVPKCNQNSTESGCSSTQDEAGLNCQNAIICQYCEQIMRTGPHSPDREAPTCTDPVKCTVEGCGEVITPASGHSEETVPGKAATCYATGLSDGKKCNREGCGIILVEQTETPMVDHTWSSGTQTKAPTCTETGTKEFFCTVCNGAGITEIKTEKVEIDPTAHAWGDPTYDWGENNTTCTAMRICIADGSHVETESVDVTEATTDATCIANGKIVYTATFKNTGFAQQTRETVIESEGHNHVGVVTTPATCTGTGIKTFTCSACSDSYTEIVDKLGHSFINYVSDEDATCTEDGHETAVCDREGCNLIDTRIAEGSKLGHDLQQVAAKAPTCLATGNNEYWNCQREGCGLIVKADKETPTTVAKETLPKLEHEYEAEVIPPTCLEQGYTTHTCKNGCEDTYSDTYVNALGHEYNEGVVTTDPTCVDKGVKTFTCVNEGCTAETEGHSYTEEVEVLGHNHVLDEEKSTEAGCTNDGENVYVCDQCEEGTEGHSYTEVVKAKGHDWFTGSDAKQPTCMEEGWTGSAMCGNCYARTEGEAIPKIDHTWNTGTQTKAPTCTQAEEWTYTCTVKGCGATTVETMDKAAHKTSFVEAKAATCTEEGYEAHYTCATCDNLFADINATTVITQVVIPATNHTTQRTPAKEATCLTNGNNAYYTCQSCGLVFKDALGNIETTVEAEVIESTGHNYNTVVTPPTCTEMGYTTYTCSVCAEGSYGHSYKGDFEDALDHNYTSEVTIQPTCTGTGIRTYTCMNDPKHTYTKEVAALDHEFVNYISNNNATCTEDGTETAQCERCTQRDTRTAVDSKLGHDEVVDVAIEATCTTEGKTEGKHCDRCKTVLVAQEIVSALGHTEVIDAAVAATCTATGLTEGKHCSACDDVLVKQEIIPAKGHTEAVDPAKAPTCTETGLGEGKHCSVCNEVLVAQEVIPAKGHTEEVIPAKDSTCEKTGLTEGTKCSVCGEILVAQEEIPALGHNWDSGRVTVLPDCVKEGVRTFTCGNCNGTKTEAEPALGHDVVVHEAKKPTYTSPGWEAYETCNRCEDYNTMVSVPALGEPEITNFEEFIYNLEILEEMADTYVKKVSPGKDPLMLIIKYIRTGVDRYNSGSWNIMAGYEDADFAKYIADREAEYNLTLAEGEEMMKVTGLKNLHEFKLPNGDLSDIGHVFGSMDITYTNKSSEDHADVSGWAGDTVDLMSMVDQFGWESTDVEGMVEEINKKYFLKYREEFEEEPIEGTFSNTDVEGDLDAFYVMQQLYSGEYENGTLTDIFSEYMTPQLTSKYRASFFLANRLDSASLRTDIRDAVYNEYVANGVVATLEGTRPFQTNNLNDLRKACCYVFADYLCRLAGDFVEIKDNPYFSVFQSTSSNLAPGISQKINYATTADGKTMVYYLATSDVSRGDVHVYANYNNNDPAAGWEMSRVIDQANAAQKKYGDPESEKYIENYNVIASINGAGYDMSTGEPSGILVMNGVTYHPIDGHGFFGILDDGSAMIGTMEQFKALQAERPGRVQEAIATFGDLIHDGKIIATNGGDRASRTAVGITATGKVVFMVLDGRQGDLSCGGDMMEIAQIMLDAGCVEAVNLDGGGSSTYVAREEGATELSVVSKPSDGISRSVSTSLMVVSTAPSSTAFDHAVVDSEYAYFTVGSSGRFEATAVSATGNVVEMPEGVQWAVADAAIGSITEDGVFTAAANGTTEIQLKLDGVVVGEKKINVVVPDNVYFEKAALNAIYGEEVLLPVKAVYEGKSVAITEADVTLSLADAAAGTITGFVFLGDEACGLKKVKVNAVLNADTSVTASMQLALYTKEEASFDFEHATGGDRQLAWNREVSNSTQDSANIYRAVDTEQDMTTTYTFAIDMSQIDMPKKLQDLTYMLPGADMEDASAWNFLLQLAERVSVLTEVTPVLYFDKNLEVDLSEMTIANEYFDVKDSIYNEEENSLTLVMKWKRQEKPIDAATANPMCILSGIKLTPKDDAAWSHTDSLAVVNKGTIGYDIYLRANALHSFSVKPENQEIYDLYPFENVRDDGVQENGGHFKSVYKEFQDNYTLINGVKDGWVVEGGGFAYYVNGEKYTGICEIDGYYYDFGNNGVNIGQKKYSGDMTDTNGNEYYLVDGVKQTGWLVLDMKNVRYFNPKTGIREKLTADEIPSTCIIDGQCLYTTESGEQKLIQYDDAAGHEYVKQASGAYVCSTCGWERIEMPDVNVSLATTVYTYNGNARTPATTATAKDGRLLTKPGQSEYPDYYSTYNNNVNVGTASVTLTARKYGVFVNKTEWRGNAAESITVPYEIRPDLPKNATITGNADAMEITWTAALAPNVTYVIYASADGQEWKEIATTTELSYALSKELASGLIQIGTRKVVGDKTYESVNRAAVKNDTLMVVTGNNDDGKPTLKWNAVKNAASYEVYRSKTENGTFTNVFTTKGVSYTHASAVGGNTYYYYVKAVLNDGTERTSSVVSGTAISQEIVFEVTTGNNENGKPTLKWNKVDGADHYEVYRADTEKGSYTKTFTTKGTTYTNTGAKAGNTYYYQVKSIMTDGTEIMSDTVSATCEKIAEPFTIDVGNNDAGKPTLKWTKVDGADHYDVYRAESKEGVYTKTFTTKGTSYTNTSAKADNIYYYQVKIVMADGTETMSYVVSAICGNKDTPFAIVTGNNVDGKPTLNWNAISGAERYEVYRSNSVDGTFMKAFSTTGRSYTNTSAKAGNTYYYKLKVYMVDGTEKFSHVVSEVCMIPGAIFTITADNNAIGKPTLKWNPIAGAERYEVYRSGSANGKFVLALSTKGTTYTNTSAKPGNTYYYKLKVYMVDGTEEFSHVVSKACLDIDACLKITTGNNDAGKPTLKWNPIVGAKTYEVYRSASANGKFVLAFSTKGTTYTNTSAKAGNTYYYKVKVHMDDGKVETSKAVSKDCLKVAQSKILSFLFERRTDAGAA